MSRVAGPVTPTPKKVYEVRIFHVHLTGKGLGRGGRNLFFKAPYGTYVIAAQILARAVARQQISTFTLGWADKDEIEAVRSTVTRFDEAFEVIADQLGIDWAA